MRSTVAASFLAALLAPALVATPALAGSPWSTGTVKGVIDGDSIEVRFEDGTVEEVRLIGVDADEGTGCDAVAAREHAEDELLNPDASVRLRIDRRHDESDQLRLFAYVYVDNQLFNLEQVREGYARERDYGGDYQFRSRFEAAERSAQRQGLGVWDESGCP